MSFSSYEFILVFLPAAFLITYLAHRIGGWDTAIPVLGVISVLFYSFFGTVLVLVLILSVLINYQIGNMLISMNGRKGSGYLLAFGIIGNLFALGYFKYTNFAIDIVNQFSGGEFSHLNILLPVGVSFFTFIQTGYLIEAYGGQVKKPGLSKYLLFATFFPCVTAGPLVLQKEIFEQLDNRKSRFIEPQRIIVGLTIFAIGLFKKVVIADSIAPYANTVFDRVADGQLVTMAAAWLGSLAYTIQLYFDFSGYSDMAIGIGLIFGLKLPLNFNSPLKATSISDFWRRWHMTMTRFFTNYVFSPLAMNGMRRALGDRYGHFRKYTVTAGGPVIVTFLVAGIWHGAGWTFVVYGLIHGFALAIDHAWREFNGIKLPNFLGWALTMSVVVSGLVVFRAADLDVATHILATMWGVAQLIPNTIDASIAVYVEFDKRMAATFILLFGTIILAAPNSQELMRGIWKQDELDRKEFEGMPIWKPSPMWSIATALVLLVGITSMGDNSAFLYYQF
ncbi:MAG: MBOAT family O-acyltransferase [Methyloligellaceae bacterium]